MKRGIFLVANRKSQNMSENLIYSIRESGCKLPIRLIHFGGEEINSSYIFSEVEYLKIENFVDDAKKLVAAIHSVLPDNRPGLIYRYLAWFSDWDEFIYSDNDIVALCNWETLFDYLKEYDFVHADKEYTTEGLYDYEKPTILKQIFGINCLNTALTSGHIVVKRSGQMINDMYKAVDWFNKYNEIPKKNDQAFMHIACMLGNWNKLNLCQLPNSWLSSWAGDYKNSLELIQTIQLSRNLISHIHYSGSTPKGNLPIEDLLFSKQTDKQRLISLYSICIKALSGYHKVAHQYTRAKRFTFKKFFAKINSSIFY